LIEAYRKTGLQVFHLMGGAPGLYLKHWREIANKVDVFHSDLLLVEESYDINWLIDLPGLFIISVKDFKVDMELFWRNFDTVINSGIDFYITFTGRPILREAISQRYGKEVLRDSFVIDIVEYEATKMAKRFLEFSLTGNAPSLTNQFRQLKKENENGS
jgi:hypothetical protein